MKKMTEKQWLSMTFEEAGFWFNRNGFLEHDTIAIPPKTLGIEIIHEPPEVNQENLCKFWLLFKEWPRAEFMSSNDGQHYSKPKKGILVRTEGYDFYKDGSLKGFSICSVTDPRWFCIADGHEVCERCREARGK